MLHGQQGPARTAADHTAVRYTEGFKTCQHSNVTWHDLVYCTVLAALCSVRSDAPTCPDASKICTVKSDAATFQNTCWANVHQHVVSTLPHLVIHSQACLPLFSLVGSGVQSTAASPLQMQHAILPMNPMQCTSSSYTDRPT